MEIETLITRDINSDGIWNQVTGCYQSSLQFINGKGRTSAASCWELKLNGAWRDPEILWEKAHKKFDGSTGLLDLDFIFMFRIIDFRSGDKDDDSDGTLIQSDGRTLSVCRMAFA